MKSLRRSIIVMLGAALAIFALALFGACGGKGQKEVTLTFYANGGTAVEAVTAKPGDEVDLPVTEREHHTFTGWYLEEDLSGEPLTGSISAPKKDTSYYAGWKEDAKVSYTVYVYFQNVAATAYTRPRDEAPIEGEGYVGETVTPDPTFDHFTFEPDPVLGASNPAPVTTLTLSEDSEENVFYLYFSRMTYTVAYDANLPASLVSGSVPSQSVRYEGRTATMENGFSAEGYRFVGWSLKRSDVSNDEIIFAGDREDLLTVLGPTTLYAVWDEGYHDRAGSSDLVFFPRLEEGVAYMLRGGHEFTGEREGDSFTFKKESGEVMLEGRAADGFFSYKNHDVAATYVLYDTYSDPKYQSVTDPARYDASVTLELDEYLNATYTDKAGKTHTGALLFDATRGDYLLSAEDGEKLHVQFRHTDAGSHPYIFSIGGPEAGYYAEMLSIEFPYPTGEMLVLDGYGLATLYLNTAEGVFLGFDGTYYIPATVGDPHSGEAMYKVFVDIVDELGMLQSEPGEYASYVMTIPLDTQELEEDFDGYIISNGLYLGFGQDDRELTYAGKDGETLFLDGLGYFADSAVYKDKAGNTHKGSYVYKDDTYSGFIVTLTEETGDTFTFKLAFDRGGYTFETFDPAEEGSYREFRHMTDVLDYPVLILFEDTVEVNGAQKPRAEIWITLDGGNTVFKGGEGWYETDGSIGRDIYTFHLTQAVEGYAALVPEEMKFYTTQVNRSDNNRPIDVYFLLEENGEKHYTEYSLADGSTIWGNNDPTVLGAGSLWLREGGEPVEGSFSLGVNTYFNYSYIQFVYGDETGAAVRARYIAGEDDLWTPIQGVEVELQIYIYTEGTDGMPDTAGFYTNLVLDRFLIGDTLAERGNAVYDYRNADQPDWQSATYEVVDTTVFGEDIYSLKINGTEIFRFVVTYFSDVNGNGDYVYFTEDETLAGEYSSPEGGSLRLDGFYWAEYLDGEGNRFEGTYSVDPDGDELYFTPSEGLDFYISIDKEEGAFYPLDGAYGEWIVVDRNMNPVGEGVENGDYLAFTFDGRGNATVSFIGSASGARTGIYEAVDASNYEYRVYINLPGLGTNEGNGWYIQLYPYDENLAILFDVDTSGTFINENWDVLWLDGFGGGVLRAADGSISATGMYTVLDEQNGFMMFTYGENENAFFLFDRVKRSFRIIDYSEASGVWFSQDLDYVAFGEDGFFQIGARGEDAERTSGAYYFDEDNFYLVFYTFEVLSVPRPQTAETPSLTIREKVYYRAALEEGVLTMKGVLNFYERDGETPLEELPSLNVTLAISVNIGPNYNNAATVTVEAGQEHAGAYEGFLFNIYTNGEVRPRISYQDFTYFVTFRFDGTGASTFDISAGYTSIRMLDFYNGLQEGGEEGNGNYTGGEITKEILGFGPIMLDQAFYSGKFLYENKNPSAKADPVVFEDVAQDAVRVLGHRSDLNGDLLEILFDVSGKHYAVDFVESYAEEVGACYILWGFYEYEERELVSGGKTYTLGLKHLIRATAAGTPGYGRDGYNLNPSDLVGEVVYVTLIDGENIIEAVDSGVTLSKDGVWLAVAKQGGGFSGYLFTFRKDAQGAIEEVTLEIRNFTSAEAVGGFLVYFLCDDQGDPVNVLAIYSKNESGLYSAMEDVSDFTEGEDEGTWLLNGKTSGGMSQRYMVRIVRDAAGKYVVTVTVVR